MKLIEYNNVSKRIDKQQILDNISFDIYDNEIVTTAWQALSEQQRVHVCEYILEISQLETFETQSSEIKSSDKNNK